MEAVDIERFEGRLKDLERRMNTAEEAQADVLTVARHDPAAVAAVGDTPADAHPDLTALEKRVAKLERAAAAEAKAAKADAAAEAKADAEPSGFSMPNPFASPGSGPKPSTPAAPPKQ